jgi:phosphohistidine phosphatase SixA
MKQIRILLAIWACLALPALAAPAAAPVPAAAPAAAAAERAKAFVEVLAGPELLGKLRQGGFVLYLRHGSTDNTRADRVPLRDFNDCDSQRPLTEQGRKMMQRVGEALRAARIPLLEVLTSPLCRAKESTAAAFPEYAYTIDNNLAYTANLTDAQKAPIIANTRRLLSAPVAAGRNRMLVAHGPNLMDLIGYFPAEGTLAVFRPGSGAGFEYVASIPPGLWTELLR